MTGGSAGASFFDYPGIDAHQSSGGSTFLSEASEADWASVVAHCERRHCRQDETVVSIGEKDRALIIVRTGSFRITAPTRRSRMQIVGRVPAGSVFGEIGFLDGQPRTSNVISNEDSEILVLGRASYERLSRSQPSLALHMVEDLGGDRGDALSTADGRRGRLVSESASHRMSDATSKRKELAFANFVEAPTSLDLRVWFALRALVLVGFLGIIVFGFVRTDDMPTLFWGVLVPVLPAIWLLAPGLWRNTCPLATMNQLPRVFGFSRERTVPLGLQRFSYTIAAVSFFALALTRKMWFNGSGRATAILLLMVVSLAFLGGISFKGKSGWCSAFCPLLPIQRLYGQAPVARVPNAHCQPCVGCTPNCFDFNPGVAYVADQHESDPTFRGPRRLFAGAFPGLVIAFFTIGNTSEVGVARMYGESLLWIIGGMVVIAVADAHLRIRPNALPPLFGAIGFGLFYYYGTPGVARALEELVGGTWTWIYWPTRIAAWLAAAMFLRRAWQAETRFESETMVELVARAAIPAAVLDGELGQAQVSFAGVDEPVAAPEQPTLLEVVEAAGLALSSGCRAGVCGADPVAVLAGQQALSEPSSAELSTLRTLGLGPPNRLACMARVLGTCSVSLEPDPTALPIAEESDLEPDPTVRRVVIVGNGVAGMTAADHVRRNHPECEVDIVALEAHHLYNRMGISKLIYSPMGVEDLQLLPSDWHAKNNIGSWLNTRIVSIDRDAQELVLGTRARMSYDRLILATGSNARIPPIEGLDLAGCYSLRSGEHAVQIRSYAQEHGARTAFVAGGGLLGLEAAYSLHRLGLQVTVGERSERVLRRQVDARASEILTSFFEGEGIEVRHNVEIAEAVGDGRLSSLTTTTGEHIDADLLLVAAGITPSVRLAEEAGLEVHRGVVVDDGLRTSDPNIFAIGDLAEHQGAVWGLWTVAVTQGEIAARNAVGASDIYFGDVPTTVLKGAGINMTSFGVFDAEPGDEVEVLADLMNPPEYRKTVWRDGVLIGGTFINAGEAATEAQAAYQEGLEARQRNQPVAQV